MVSVAVASLPAITQMSEHSIHLADAVRVNWPGPQRFVQREGSQQNHLVRVNISDKRGVAGGVDFFVGNRPIDFAGGDALGQGPFDLSCLAGIASIAPIRMPGRGMSISRPAQMTSPGRADSAESKRRICVLGAAKAGAEKQSARSKGDDRQEMTNVQAPMTK